MNIKRILLISILAVAIVASFTVVSAGLFDGLMGGEQKDNVIEIDNITFNATNATKFKLENKNDTKRDYVESLDMSEITQKDLTTLTRLLASLPSSNSVSKIINKLNYKVSDMF